MLANYGEKSGITRKNFVFAYVILKMQQIKLMSKLGLGLIAIAAISAAVAVQAYYIQAADAQARLPNNSVRTENIVDGEVRTGDLADNAVTKPKMADNSVGSAEIENGAITTAKILDRQVTSDKLASGAVGMELRERIGDSVSLEPGTANFAIVDCEAGEIAISGGFRAGSDIRIIGSEANGDNNDSWSVHGYNDGDSTASFAAMVECFRLTP